MSTIKSEMEARYRETLTERRKAAATLELELEKERQRVQGYKQALISQSQHLMEERKQLQQVKPCLAQTLIIHDICCACSPFNLLPLLRNPNSVLLHKEREALEGEKQRHVRSGAAGAVLHQALERENSWYYRAVATLRELESQLVERQNAYCSYVQPREQRLEMEKNMLLKVVKEPIGTELDLESDLKDIFKRDRHCADMLNTDKRKNGSLMWVYLKYWQLQVTVQKHKRAEKAILGGQAESPRK